MQALPPQKFFHQPLDVSTVQYSNTQVAFGGGLHIDTNAPPHLALVGGSREGITPAQTPQQWAWASMESANEKQRNTNAKMFTVYCNVVKGVKGVLF